MSAKSFKPQQVIGLLSLLVISLLLIRFAGAITAFTPQAQPTGYVAQPEVTNFNLTSGNEVAFIPDYEREFWSGNLYAYPVDATGTVNLAGELWTLGAANSIEAQDWNTGRFIATMKDDGTAIPFRYASLSAAQQAYFPASTINLMAVTGTQIVDFLRGDRSNEGPEAMRIRNYALGDIVHSRPYYVKDATYPTVFVGANDGMLHAINTADGSERWAYVPSMLLSKMQNLAKPYGGVTNPHDYFVDGQINIGTVTISGTPTRILVGLLGAGGRGIYALKIQGSAGLNATSEADVASKVLWEINGTTNKVNYAAPTTAGAYLNLGHTYGIPAIGKVKSGSGTVDAILLGNGYNDNPGGDHQAYLYVIEAATGQLIGKVQAGTSGSVSSPNGLSSVAPIDSDNNGVIDRVYAGDLDGHLWRFDLAGTPASWTATLLHTTSPAQPITVQPGVGIHPNGGYMINFVTGSIFTDARTDTSTYYAYGIWENAIGMNLISQTLEERSYSPDGGTTQMRVRRVVNPVTPNWATDKGWRVALPAGERGVGDGTFIENGRYYFNSTNPTKLIKIPDPCNLPNCANQTDVYGENWLMELHYLSGAVASNQPFLDLNNDLLLDDNDRVSYILSDLPTPPDTVGSPIRTVQGVPVGKFLGFGAISQPLLVQLRTLNTTLYATNPDIVFPYNDIGFGVTGGHFDEDIYHNCTLSGTPPTPAIKATATITVGTTGQYAGYPATLGNITVDGITIVPALTTAEIPDGIQANVNAATIKNKVTAGYTASVSGNVVTITAPTAGASFNGKTLVVNDGTSSGSPPSPGSPGSKAVGSVTFTYASSNTAKNVSALTITVNGETLYSGSNLGKISPSALVNMLIGKSSANYVIAKDPGGSPTTIQISAKNVGAAYNQPIVVTITTNGSTPGYTKTGLTGGTDAVAATAGTGWANFKPALTVTAFSGGADATSGTTTASCSPMTTWQSKSHTHQYDDKFDKTGVDMLNASVTALNLYNVMPSASTQFKVIAQNQYLSPAVKINIGRNDYQYNVDFGYTPIRNFSTSPTLNNAAEWSAQPVYTLGTIGSLVINMPIDALTSKDWWGNGDVRAGLHPTQTGCVKKAAGANDGNMYQPVIPPAEGVDGPGTNGWNASTTPTSAQGVRHNGALTIQIVKATTPASALEMSVPGNPKYGWRVKSADYNTYVLAEYTTFWHHPNGKCYGDPGWTKMPPQDNSSSAPQTPAAGSTDPKIGDLSGGGGTVVDVTRVTVGNVTTTTITYSNGSQATITRTQNADGSIRYVTCDALGTCTTQDIAASKGSLGTGGDESRTSVKTGRISWRELIND